MESLLASALGQIKRGVVMTNNEESILYLNEYAKKILVNDEEGLGRKFHDLFKLISKKTGTAVFPVSDCLSSLSVIEEFVGHSVFSRNETLDISYTCSPIIKEDKCHGTIFLFHIVDYEYELRNELEKSLNTFRMFFDNAPIGKSMTSPDGELLRINKAFASIVGYSVEELQNINFKEITHPDDVAESVKCIRELKEGKKDEWLMEKRYIAKDGRIVWTFVTTRLQRDEKGNPLFFLTHLIDITKQKEAQKELLESKEKLEEINKQLSASNNELEQFAYIASHDLKEPLRMISSFTQLIVEKYKDSTDEKTDLYIKYIIEGSERLRSMIDDILKISRIGTRKNQFEKIDIAEIVEVVKKDLKLHIDEASAVIKISGSPIVSGDKVQIIQLFENLISNALKFRSINPPVVEITSKGVNDDFITIDVKDNGIGILPEHQGKIFQMFQRLHTRDKYPGNGIGLSLVKKIIERHGGKITVFSDEGQGTTFSFTLPC